MRTLDSGQISLELIARRQWVCWRPDKTPVDPKTGQNAKANDPATWGEYKQAVKHYQAYQDNSVIGVGFEFCQADSYVGIDWISADTRKPEVTFWKYRLSTNGVRH